MTVNILPSSYPHPINTDTAKISSANTKPNLPKPPSSVTTNPNPFEQKLHTYKLTANPTISSTIPCNRR